MERYIDKVKKSISAKEPPLKVAETRLSKRSKAVLQVSLFTLPFPLTKLTT